MKYFDTDSARYCVRIKDEDPPKDWKMLKRGNLRRPSAAVSQAAKETLKVMPHVEPVWGTNRGADRGLPCAANQGRSRGDESASASRARGGCACGGGHRGVHSTCARGARPGTRRGTDCGCPRAANSRNQAWSRVIKSAPRKELWSRLWQSL